MDSEMQRKLIPAWFAAKVPARPEEWLKSWIQMGDFRWLELAEADP